MLDGLDSLLTREEQATDGTCGCTPAAAADGDVLRIEATDCPGEGRLSSEPGCRATAVSATRGRDLTAIRTQAAGVVRQYEGRGVALLVAAGRFAERVRPHDETLADRAREDPLDAAARAAGRSGQVARIGAECGLLAVAEDARDDPDLLSPLIAPAVSRSLVARTPPSDAVLAERYQLETGAVVRLYDRQAADEPRWYHIEPPAVRLSTAALEMVATARERLAAGIDSPERAVAAVLGEESRATNDEGEGDEEAATAASDGGATATESDPPGDEPDTLDPETADSTQLTRVLRKHTSGMGVLADLFADGAVSDVFATAPVAETPLRVRRADESMLTNVRLTRAGAEALASRFRRDSGRAFSRAEPTLAATTEVAGRRVRVAGVTGPVSDGHAFALRAHDRTVRRLPDLITNGTVPPAVAGLLSLAVERGVACLVTGERGAGKTTLLGALLWELPPTTRTVVVEDTPELPATALREAGRDVQTLRVGTGAPDGGDELSAAEALRTALRLGEGALVVGEIRGEEAGVLYEAMRVGAGGAAVLGTVHGDGASTVRERMVSDLGVPASAFADTDLVVTVEGRETNQGRDRRVRRVEEVLRTDDGGAAFEPLYERVNGSLDPTRRLETGASVLLEGLRAPAESYDETMAATHDRGRSLAADAEGEP